MAAGILGNQTGMALALVLLAGGILQRTSRGSPYRYWLGHAPGQAGYRRLTNNIAAKQHSRQIL